MSNNGQMQSFNLDDPFESAKALQAMGRNILATSQTEDADVTFEQLAECVGMLALVLSTQMLRNMEAAMRRVQPPIIRPGGLR